eukprot:2391267-Pleurochrysis_carterae.AAC.1
MPLQPAAEPLLKLLLAWCGGPRAHAHADTLALAHAHGHGHGHGHKHGHAPPRAAVDVAPPDDYFDLDGNGASSRNVACV